MELTPWKPFRELSSLRRDLDTLWDKFFGETSFPRLREREWVPAVDVSQTEENVIVQAEVPGFEAKDIDVSVSGDVLTIKGEKEEEKEEKEEQYHSKEIYSSSFQRSTVLPAEVQSDKVDATFKNGVLKIVLPKAEETKTKKIEIKTG